MSKTDKETSRFVWADRDDTSCEIDVSPKKTTIPDVTIENNQKNEMKPDQSGKKSKG